MKTTIVFLLVILVVVPSDTMEADTKGKKKTGMSKRPTHPKYSVMISDAISVLKERGGSSRQAILKYIVVNYKLENMKTTNILLKMALRAGVISGALKHTKGTCTHGSYGVGKEDSKPFKKVQAKKDPRQENPSKESPSKETLSHEAPAKKDSAKKSSAKKTTAKKAPAKNAPSQKPSATKAL